MDPVTSLIPLEKHIPIGVSSGSRGGHTACLKGEHNEGLHIS